MVFNSYTFIIFFALVASIYNLPIPWVWKKRHLLLASYLFYAAWNPPFVLLLWLSTVVDWYVAKWMAASEEERRRRLLLILSLVINLGLLAFFKYAGFLIDTVNFVLGLWSLRLPVAAPSIILPAGISFYTFMTLSYSLDVFYRRTPPCKSFLDYALFLTFFPHLVSGPIVRAAEFTPQLEAPKQATAGQFALGLCLITYGLFEKTVLADYFLASPAEQLFKGEAVPDLLSAWCGILAFAGQIFYDFSGYTTCAIGVAMCFGFTFPENFRFPYAAAGFSDFWQRWHMSLSRWLRDYLYIPLGGNRHGTARLYRNLMLTMLLGGLWHGASWTFVIWGAMHGLFLIAERIVTGHGTRKLPGGGPGRALITVATFVCICFTWVFFRAHSLPQAFAICQGLLGVRPSQADRLLAMPDILRVVLVTTALLATHWVLRDTTWIQVFQRLRSTERTLLLALLLAMIVMAPGIDRAFVYFQF